MPKDFAATDRHAREQDPRAAFRRRYDDSRKNLFEVSLGEVAPNPKNPRYPDDPKVIETAGSLQEVGQLQPIILVTRDAFIEAYPDLDGGPNGVPAKAKYVIAIGNRRYAGARLKKWKTLEAILAPSIATAAEIEDRVLHENIHREPLPPLLEAIALKNKQDREGLSLRELAEKLQKSHTYVDSRLNLLKLIPEFQDLMRREWPLPNTDRTLKLKLAGTIAKLDHAQQQEIWEAGTQRAAAGEDTPFRIKPVIPDYSSPSIPAHEPALEGDPAATAEPVDDSAPPVAVNPDYSDAPDTRPTSTPITPAATPTPELPEATTTPAPVWPLRVEADNLTTLAAALTERLSQDERAELAQLIQPST